MFGATVGVLLADILGGFAKYAAEAIIATKITAEAVTIQLLERRCFFLSGFFEFDGIPLITLLFSVKSYPLKPHFPIYLLLKL